MSGKRLISFRAGDRSEYLAAYGLSRIAFVHPAPRPEDFGVVDFLCVLGREDEASVFPESAFYVQVKSRKDPVVLDGDAVRWVSNHMDHPLLLCVADKTASELTFYSCSRIWLALFLRTAPRKVSLLPDSELPPHHYELQEDEASGATFKVHLGPPILRQSISELEQNPRTAYSVIESWIRADAANIARRRLGRIVVSCISKWQTNHPPGDERLVRYYFGPDFGIAERDLIPMLTALAHNYRHHRIRAKFDAVREFLRLMRPLLDDHGRQIVDGSIRIDD